MTDKLTAGTYASGNIHIAQVEGVDLNRPLPVDVTPPNQRPIAAAVSVDDVRVRLLAE